MGARFSTSKAPCAASTSDTSAHAASTTDTSALVALLGDTLVTKSGTVSTDYALGGKAVGLYFSAHWCPPCRGFTPKLSEAYTSSLKQKGLEIVFVSSDRDASAFKSYFGEMPWLALPYAERSLKAKLGEKYQVKGIPSLVILDAAGNLITTDGRAKVMSDPTGSWVPAQPLPSSAPAAETAKAAASTKPSAPGGLSAVLGTAPLLDADGKSPVTLTQAAKDAPLIALYFSAHWCGPCRSFTPKLKAFVETLEASGVHLPIVFGSGDRDAAAFAEYFDTMPWLAFPFGDERVDALKRKYDVSGIPWLVVLDSNGNLVANEADTDVPMGAPAYQKWLKQAKQPVAAAPAA